MTPEATNPEGRKPRAADSSAANPRAARRANTAGPPLLSPRLLVVTVIVCIVSQLAVSRANAAVRRFAVLIGNNNGASVEIPLRYAESDAERMAAVLRELGGVQPADMVVLAGETEDSVRRTLITTKARISEAQSVPGTEVMLLVYYSGHADSDALHLGTTSLSLSELSDLVRGSPARVRLLIVDACRSGSLTRVKADVLCLVSISPSKSRCAARAWRYSPPAPPAKTHRSRTRLAVRSSPTRSSPGYVARPTAIEMA